VCDEKVRVAIEAATATSTASNREIEEKDTIISGHEDAAEKEALEAALAGCTPEAVCDEKVRVAIEAATATSTPSNCTAINAEKVAVLEEQKLEKDIKIASLTGTIESVSKNLAEKDGEIEEKDTIISGHEDALRNTVAEKALLLDLAEKDQEDLADLRLTILELKETVTNVNAEMALLLEQLASDNVRQEIEEEEEEEFEKDEATNFDYADFYSTIKNEPIVVTSCSSSGSAGGDCSRSPTFCYGIKSLEDRQFALLQDIKMHESDIKMLESDIKMLESEKIPLEQLPGGGPNLVNNIVDCRLERMPVRVEPVVEKYRGSCSGRNSCLNLDFYCVSSTVCELSCSGGNSCKGVTMYCADNQVCAIKLCGVGTDRCVGAKVVYNGMEFGEEQGWKSPPAEEYR